MQSALPPFDVGPLLRQSIEEWFSKCSGFQIGAHLGERGWQQGSGTALHRKQKELFEARDRLVRFSMLLEQMSPSESANFFQMGFKACKSLFNLHRGELREWHGPWEVRHGPLPTEAKEPVLWRQQFVPPHEAEVSRGAVSTVIAGWSLRALRKLGTWCGSPRVLGGPTHFKNLQWRPPRRTFAKCSTLHASSLRPGSARRG